VDGECKATAIVSNITLNQERHYGRAVMSAYLGVVVGPNFRHIGNVQPKLYDSSSKVVALTPDLERMLLLTCGPYSLVTKV
jgi:hypothetical protein